MASSNAAWVFGGVRLISSASSRLQKSGPRINRNSRVAGFAVGLENFRAGNVGGHQIGRELDAAELEIEHFCDGADHECLGHAGHADQQGVAAANHRHEDFLDHVELPDNDLADLPAGSARRAGPSHEPAQGHPRSPPARLHGRSRRFARQLQHDLANLDGISVLEVRRLDSLVVKANFPLALLRSKITSRIHRA